MKFLKKYYKILLLSFFLFVFVFVCRYALRTSLGILDLSVYGFISSFRNPVLTEVFMTISLFSGSAVLIILSLCLLFVFKNKKYCLLSFLNLILVVFVNQILKLLFSRPRPFEWMITEESGYSFPSGHAMVSSAFYGMIIYLIWRTSMPKKIKILWTVILSLLIILICISRIYLGVHYTSDVIGGVALSLSYLLVATSLIEYYLKWQKKK